MPSPQIAQTSTEPACSSAAWQVHLLKTLFPENIRSKFQPVFPYQHCGKTPICSASIEQVCCCSARGVCVPQLQATSQPSFKSKDFLPSVKRTAHSTSQAGGLSLYGTACPGAPTEPWNSRLSQGLAQSSRIWRAELSQKCPNPFSFHSVTWSYTFSI